MLDKSRQILISELSISMDVSEDQALEGSRNALSWVSARLLVTKSPYSVIGGRGPCH